MSDLRDARDAFLPPPGVLYLDTASNAPRLRAVDAAARAAWEAGIAPWQPSMEDWNAAIERVRMLASQLFSRDGTPDPDGVALLPSVAQAMATVAQAWPLRSGDAVVVLEGEFPSTLMAWQRRCLQAGARLHPVARVDMTEGVLAALDEAPVALLVLSQSHWRDGRLLDLDAVAASAHARGVPLVLDLSQSLGVLPCDVARWRPAFATSVSYKWLLGGKGLVPLWVAPHWRDRIEPLDQHWQQRAPLRPWRFDADAPPPYRDGARRLDAGEIADPLRLAIAEAGLARVLAWTPAAIAARLGALTTQFASALTHAGLGDWILSPHSPHLIGVAPPPSRLPAVRDALAAEKVVCIERDGVFRLAPHLHVDEAEMERVAAAFIDAR